MNRAKTIFIIDDLISLFLAYVIMIWIKPGERFIYLPENIPSFLIFVSYGFIVSMIFAKYEISDRKKLDKLALPIIKSNFIILALTAILMYLLRREYFSRLIIFGTLIITTVFEFVFIIFYYIYQTAKLENNILEIDENITEFNVTSYVDKYYSHRSENDIIEHEIDTLPRKLKPIIKSTEDYSINKDIIIEESGEKLFSYISKYLDVTNPRCAVFSTTTRFNIDKLPHNYYTSLINLKRINDIKRINKFFESINAKLPKGALFIGCVETKDMRKKRIFDKFPIIIKHIIYLIDFIYKRVFPKLPLAKKLYFTLNGGRNRVISKQETFGRLYSCGFKYVHDKKINGNLVIVFQKVGLPKYDVNPSYGPLFKMRRIGKDGKIIFVYKFRTMYPFSEYLQEYIYEKHKLGSGGKFHQDIRVTTIGKIMRRFWIDELPMIVNYFRGEMKLVGVRPLSEQYLSLYNNDLRVRRLKYKPGLIPPYYADLPKNLEEVQKSELKYLDLYDKSHLITDFRYFFKAFFNILFKGARSK